MAITNVQVSAGTTANIPLSSTNTQSQASVGSASSITLQPGTGALQANLVYYPKNVAITTGAPYTVDLRGSSTTFTDDGLAASFASITSLTIIHRGSAGTITIGGGTHPFMPASAVTLNPGGRFHIDDTTTGIVITGGTNDDLQISTTGTAVPVEIIISGRAG